MPVLEVLEVSDSYQRPPERLTHLPSLKSLVVSGLDPLLYNIPLLTSFHLAHDPANRLVVQQSIAESVLNLFRTCPLLEVAFLRCNILKYGSEPDEVVSLPLLRSFTHESFLEEHRVSLLNRLSLPFTCRVVLRIDVTRYRRGPWVHDLPNPRDASYLSDIRIVKIEAHLRRRGVREAPITFKFKFRNPTREAISFHTASRYSQCPGDYSHNGFLDILKNIEVGSVETLYFHRYPAVQSEQLQATAEPTIQALSRFRNLKTLILVDCDIILPLDGSCISSCCTVDTLVVSYRRSKGFFYDHVISPVQKFAESRKKAGFPLKTLTLVLPSVEPGPSELDRLTGCIGRVEIVRGRDALNWTSKYLLAAPTKRVGRPLR